jgi:uncharacterized protein (TIGR00106 family)
MRATAEIQVIPIGAGVTVRQEVKRAHRLLGEAPLEVQLHSMGSNVEGELRDILDAVIHIHETLHAEGTVRLATNIKIGTRTDKEPSLAAKLF